MVVFPMSLFLVESDLTPINEKIDEFVVGLTKWEPEMKEKGIVSLPKITVTGKDYKEAMANMNHMFLSKQMGDGLPLLEATEDRLEWLLQGTDLARNTEVGRIAPRGGICTVEVAATALAMAGGRPEYLPVLIAIVEGIVEPGYGLASLQATSRSNYPSAIVNGPIGNQIRLNHIWGLLGPNPIFPAGGAIGRALRLIMLNTGGAIPGSGTMSQFAGMRYTNAVFSEDEEGYPPGWDPLNVEYGYIRGTNTIAVSLHCLTVNILRRGAGTGETLEEEALESLQRCADYMRLPKRSASSGKQGILIYSSVNANQMMDMGWTKQKIKEKLWELTHSLKAQVLVRGDYVREYMAKGTDLTKLPALIPMYSKPDCIDILVAGGHHPTHCYWLGEGKTLQFKEIKLPAKAKWDALLAQAEKDLGPMPA